MAGSSEITAFELTMNEVTELTTVAIEANDTADAYLDVSRIDGSKVLFIVEQNGTDTDMHLTIKDGAQYTAGAVGNVVQGTTADGEYMFVLETSRFKDSDGYIRLGKATADTSALNVRAILLP